MPRAHVAVGNKNGKKLATLLALLLVSTSVLGQLAAYPAKQGLVSDYAGKLDQSQIAELAGLIKDYERQTSIEFAVVVVDNLQGQSAREYALGIGNSWGVGKAEKNNGIVLLWAPTERVYSLRIADGLSADISDSDAKRITNENLLPNFRRGEYYAGLKETVQATMEQLGARPWEERLQARTQRQQQQASQAEEDQSQQRLFAQVVLAFVVVIGIGVSIGIAAYRSRQRKEKLAELAQANTVIADHLRAAESHVPQIQQLLSDFSKEAPEQDMSELSNDLAMQPAQILKIKVDVQCVDFTDLASYDEMVRIRTRSEAESDLLENIKQRIADIKNAKAQSQTLMEQLAKENFTISEVRDTSRRSEVDELLSSSRHDYEQAQHNSSMSVVNWLMINEMLNRSHSQVQQAVKYSQAAPYVSSSSIFSESDSSSGSFGGGGGFSSGSGSDGSY